MNIHSKLTSLCLSVFMIFALASCDVQQSTDTSNPETRVTISNDATILSQRIDLVNSAVPKNSSISTNTADFMYLADVRTPTVRGQKLSATAIHIRGDYAFVTYHLNGVDYGGAIDVIDVSDASNPQIVSNISFSDTDLNDITLNDSGTFAYVTGGRKQASSGYDAPGHNGAIVAEIEVQDDSGLTSNMRETPLKSFSGNSIEISGDTFVVTTGGTGGGIYVLDKQSFSVQDGIDRDLARHVDIEGDVIVGMALNVNPEGTTKLYRLNANSNQVDSLDTKAVVTPEDGKNVIDLHNNLVYTSLSDKGYKVFDFSNPSAPVASFNLKANGLANGLDADDDYLYMAAGSEGLYVAELPNLNEVFSFDNAQGSANYVEADGEFIFLAKGTDGLNILKRKDTTPADPTACPFDASDGTVVEFQNNRIRSEQSESEAQTDLANVNLSQGTYTVKLYGFDDHRADGFDRSQQNQPNESFFVSLLNGGSEVAQTGALGDLPDDSNLGTRTTTINNFQLPNNVDQARGVHAAYPDNGSANSLNAKCAVFKKN